MNTRLNAALWVFSIFLLILSFMFIYSIMLGVILPISSALQ